MASQNIIPGLIPTIKQAIVTTSWDDGHPVDLKLAELLQQYHVPATFYIPLVNPERETLNEPDIREIAQYFEVGGHGYYHTQLTRLPPQEAWTNIREGKEKLEAITGQEVRAFSYPWGQYRRDIATMVSSTGFIGARTVKLFQVNPNNPFKLGTTVYARDIQFLAYLKHTLSCLDIKLCIFTLRNNLPFHSWEEVAIDTMEYVTAHGGVWHLWGHSWEIERNNDWDRLEKVLSRMSKLPPEVTRASNGQVMQWLNWRKQGS